MQARLPIDDVIPELLEALGGAGMAVLEAPPGAGKTTRVPLAMLEGGITAGRILMLEPRRLATRAAAERMAETLGETAGQRVGYRMRGESAVSAVTRIEVVTEGILTRMIQADPSLPGVGAVIFDEFHERSLNADLGLALCLELRAALREDLLLLVMSATLDGAGVAELLGGAPVVRSAGRAFEVETRWLDWPLPKEARLETAVADLVTRAVDETEGGILVFLPGEGEIRRTEAALRKRLPEGCVLRPLYGAMPFAAQRAAIRPDATARKVVLATSIAETSLTIEDIRVVVDAGRARRARFDPGAGMSRLITERVTRAEAEQRRGRAGRVAEGVCYRLWARAEDGALAPYPPAEIEAADLAGLALELALWGARSPDDLALLTPPPQGAFAAARRLLEELGALGPDGAITGHGRKMARLPVHPRLAHMLLRSGVSAAPLAALLAERDPLRGAGADLALRLAAIAGRTTPGADPGALARIRREIKRLEKVVPAGKVASPAEQAALAYPDRVGLRRPGDIPRYVLSGGKGAVLDSADALAVERLIVVTDTDGNRREARIRQAIAISEAELRAVLGDRITWHEDCHWSPREGRVLARRQERLGSVVLAEQIWADAPPDNIARAMLDGVRAMGLRLTARAARLATRAELVRAGGADLPDMSEAGLMEALGDWLLPFLGDVQTEAGWKVFDQTEALKAFLGWDGQKLVDRAAPGQFTTPLGRRVPISYEAGVPEISVRLQEMFGVTRHPLVGGTPLKVTLLSPAGRPVQTTTDLPGFWASSYADVRKDMRGRYPKHPWPEDPTEADPTLRAKPRKS